MGVQAQITRLEEAKAALVSAIIAKGVTVPEGALLDALSAYVSQIETGADVSGVTAAAADVVAGKKFVTAAGELTDGTMAEVTQATPSITVSSAGLITASATQAAGKVAAGTKSATKQLTTQAAKTVTPTTSEQVAVAAGVYTTGAVKVAAIGAESMVTGLTSDLTSGTSAIISGLTFGKVKTVFLAKASANTNRYWTLAYFLHNGAGKGRMYHSSLTGIYTDITNICSFTYSNGTLTIVTTQTGNANMVGIHRYFIIGE